VVLAIVAVIVTLVAGAGDPEPLPEGSPEKAVQDFILAVDDGDFEAAYAMLHPDLQDTCPVSDFRRYIGEGRDSGFRVSLKSVDYIREEAHVTVAVTTFSGSPPFDFSEYTSDSLFVAVQVDGTWLIREAPWPFSGCPYLPPKPTATPTRTPTPTDTPTPTPAPSAA
jgi:hypothetical protein